MDILFLHDNYPGQFRHLAGRLAADPGHRVVFVTARADVKPEQVLPGLRVLPYSLHRPPSAQMHRYLRATEEGVLRGQAITRCLHRLAQDGFHPRLVIFHVGRGLGLYLRALLPEAVLIGYCEWFFRTETLPALVGEVTLDGNLQARTRNLTLLQELSDMDRGVVPTSWQKQQFPAEYQPRLEVVFDGIDTGFFHPGDRGEQELVLPGPEGAEPLALAADGPVLTYATRGMEPLRGFPEFLRLLPPLLAAEPRLQVVVAGQDRRVYSYPAPSHGGSWKQHLLEELGAFEGRDRLHFVGGLPRDDYRRLLQRTDLHLHFSRPYVPSWSLFEAAACGAPIVMNEGPGTTGTLPGAAFARVDLDQPPGVLAEQVREALGRSWAARARPRPTLLPPELELSACLGRWQTLLNAALNGTAPGPAAAL